MPYSYGTPNSTIRVPAVVPTLVDYDFSASLLFVIFSVSNNPSVGKNICQLYDRQGARQSAWIQVLAHLAIDTMLIIVVDDDVIKWKHFRRYWPFVQGIHQSPVNNPHKGQWHGALMFSLICAWTNDWINNRDAGHSRRHCAHYDVTVMILFKWYFNLTKYFMLPYSTDIILTLSNYTVYSRLIS